MTKIESGELFSEKTSIAIQNAFSKKTSHSSILFHARDLLRRKAGDKVCAFDLRQTDDLVEQNYSIKELGWTLCVSIRTDSQTSMSKARIAKVGTPAGFTKLLTALNQQIEDGAPASLADLFKAIFTHCISGNVMSCDWDDGVFEYSILDTISNSCLKVSLDPGF